MAPLPAAAAALLLLAVGMVEAAAPDYDAQKPAALAGCYWRATIKEQGNSYGKVTCGAFRESDCNITNEPGAGYGGSGGPVEGFMKSHKGVNDTNPRDCGVHNEDHGAPKRTAPTCGTGNDASGAACAVNAAGDDCVAKTGDCKFYAGTEYGNAGGSYGSGIRMGIDACESMMVGSCWGSDNKPRCVAGKDQCQPGETYKEWNYKCNGEFVCAGGCKQAQTPSVKPVTKYGVCGDPNTGRCALDSAACDTGETFTKPYTTGMKSCPCNLVQVGGCKRIANPPKYKVKTIGSVRCVTSGDSCEAGGTDPYGRTFEAAEVYIAPTDADAIASKCFLCVDYNIDASITEWPTMTCDDPLKTYFHPYLSHSHEVQMQVKLKYSKAAFDIAAMKDKFKQAVAGAASKPGTGSRNTGAIQVDPSDVFITKIEASADSTVVVDVQIKTYSKDRADTMVTQMTEAMLNTHLNAAGRTCGTGNDAAGNACEVNEAKTGCKVESGDCSFVAGMKNSKEICNSGKSVAWTASSPQLQTPSWANSCAQAPTSTTTTAVPKTTKHFVTFIVTMPYSKTEFNKAKQDKYKAAIARAAGTAAENVEILSITEGIAASRRSASVKVETKIRASNAEDANKLITTLGTGDSFKAKINNELKKDALEETTSVTAPVAGSLNSASVRIFSSYVALAAGLLVSVTL